MTAATKRPAEPARSLDEIRETSRVRDGALPRGELVLYGIGRLAHLGSYVNLMLLHGSLWSR